MGSDPITVTAALVTVAGAMQDWQVGTLLSMFVVIPMVLFIYGIRVMALVLTSFKTEITTLRAETKLVFAELNHRNDGNGELVRRMEQMTTDLASIVSHNTATMTRLVERIKMMGREGHK